MWRVSRRSTYRQERARRVLMSTCSNSMPDNGSDLHPWTILQYFIQPLWIVNSMETRKETGEICLWFHVLQWCRIIHLENNQLQCKMDGRIGLTEKHIIMTWVSAYERERNRSNSSCPSEPSWLGMREKETILRTSSIPKTELYLLLVDINVMHVVFKDRWFTARLSALRTTAGQGKGNTH